MKVRLLIRCVHKLLPRGIDLGEIIKWRNWLLFEILTCMEVKCMMTAEMFISALEECLLKLEPANCNNQCGSSKTRVNPRD